MSHYASALAVHGVQSIRPALREGTGATRTPMRQTDKPAASRRLLSVKIPIGLSNTLRMEPVRSNVPIRDLVTSALERHLPRNLRVITDDDTKTPRAKRFHFEI
jgi:hypothetical protein